MVEIAYSRWLIHSQIQMAIAPVTQEEAVAGVAVVVGEAVVAAVMDGNFWIKNGLRKKSFAMIVSFVSVHQGHHEDQWVELIIRLMLLFRADAQVVKDERIYNSLFQTSTANTFIFSMA